jgi:hypothetical protein
MKTLLQAAMSPSDSWLGKCFRVQCSHGDDREPWYVYRRVVAETSQVVECVRIEARADGSFVLFLADPVYKSVLRAHAEIEEREFRIAAENLQAAVRFIP